MSRTQDLALARMRMLVARWRSKPVAPPDDLRASGWAGRARPEQEGSVDQRDPVGGRAGRDPRDPGGADPSVAADPVEPDLVEPDLVEPDARAPDLRAPVPLIVGLLGALVVAALALGAWMLVRSWPRADPSSLAAPSLTAARQGAGDVATGPWAGSEGDGEAGGDATVGGEPLFAIGPSPAPSLVVHVAGDVRRPGLVVLPSGARVGDAVKAAGGLSRGGEVGAANLARVLTDGERIEIGQDADGTGSVGAAGVLGPAAPVDLNTASPAQLDALPGIGPVTAAKILAWRAEHGRFTVVDELAEVPGIGPRTLEELRPHVRV